VPLLITNAAKSRILKLALIIEIIALLVAAVAMSRDYQDSWVLEGLEIPFAIFMVTYAVYMLTEKRVTWLIVFALICRSVILLIPNLKYVWFQGLYDQHSHYRLTQDIYNEGHIPSGRLYSDTPLMHLLFVIYSLITNAPILQTFKYFPVLAWFIYPLLIYLVIKKSGLMENSSILKYALIISSIPIKFETSYVVMGTLCGSLLSFLILLQMIKMLRNNDRRDWLVALIYILSLVATHTYSSIMIMVALLAICLILLLLRSKILLKLTSLSVVLTVVVVNFTWLSFKATHIFDTIIGIEILYIKRSIGFETIYKTSVPPRFFEIGFVDELKTILVFHGADILLIILTLIGVMVVIKKYCDRSKPTLMFFSLYVVSLWLFLVAGVFLFRHAEQWYERLITLSFVVSPIFSGISLFYIKKKMRNTTLIIFVIILLLMALAAIELYRCQPLIPPSTTISKDLPTDEPLVYVNIVNTAYQRYMIKHAERHIPNGVPVACDRISLYQIRGLTGYSFSHFHQYYYPFLKLLDQNVTERKFDHFLIHFPGKSGALHEKAEIRTRGLISQVIYNSSVIYANGESYILTNPFMVSFNRP